MRKWTNECPQSIFVKRQNTFRLTQTKINENQPLYHDPSYGCLALDACAGCSFGQWWFLSPTSVLFLPVVESFSVSSSTSIIDTPPKQLDVENKNVPIFTVHIATNQQLATQTTDDKDKIILTYLEINGWLLTMNNGMTVLIDPILEGPLDFGIPDIFTGTKRILPTTGLTELLPLQHIDCLLLTQGLDDHAHVQTLTKLRNCDEFSNDTPIVAPLSAKSALEASGWYGTTNNIRFIEHGQETQIVPQQQQQQQQQGAARTSRHHTTPLSIRATIGALVGPPWQKRENGYLLTCASSSSSSSSSDNTDTTPTTTTIAKNNNSNKRKNPTVSLYIEPHVEFDPNELSRYAPVDVVITPTTGQTLPGFELVHGPKDSVHLIDTLQPRFVVPMPNADIDTSGWAAPLVRTVGSPTDFERGVANNGSRKRRGSDRSTTPTIVSVEAGRDVVIEL